MEVNWFQFAMSLVAALVVAFVSARLTIHYALKRFYSEKRWERKADVYASLLEALHSMKKDSEFNMKCEAQRAEPPEDQQKELAEEFSRAHAEVRKRKDVGTFAISEEAVRALLCLEKELNESRNVHGWWAHLQAENSAVEKCLAAVRDIAKKDLGFH